MRRWPGLALSLLLLLGACVAPRPIVGPKRLALVIGNGAYQGDIPALANPSRDATAIAAMMEQNGYRTVLLLDANRSEMLAALNAFAASTTAADVAIVFYSGHGVEVNGRNLLLPVDFTSSTDADVKIEDRAVQLSEMDRILSGHAKAALIFLDACRTDPYAPTAAANVADASKPRSLPAIPGRGQGLALEAGQGTAAIVYSAQPGQTASDGTGAFSPFATAFLANLPRSNQEIRYFLPRLKLSVALATDGEQEPAWASIGNDLPATRLAASRARQQRNDKVSVTRIATQVRPAAPSAVVSPAIAAAYPGQVLVSEPGELLTEYACSQDKTGGQRTLIMNKNGPACGANISSNNGAFARDVVETRKPAHGRVIIKYNTFAYVPDTDFVGRDSFDIQADRLSRQSITVKVLVE